MRNQNTEEVSGFEGSHDAMGCVQRTVKRLFDIVFSLAGMIILSPVYLVIAIMLKRQKNGPAIFSQERIGYRGKPFTIYKFRTMKKDAEGGGIPKLVETPDDPRLTIIGAKLRKHHLDELPQLWNVIKGDMAFIGPRPERKYYIDKIMQHDPRYEQLYALRPGVTSYATLYNGYADTMEKMLRRLDMDISYLEHRSLWLDTKIIIKTALSIVTGRKF